MSASAAGTGAITMPRMGETMESGRVAVWLKKPGDQFRRGEVILEIETDKTTVEMPALDDGRLTEILVGEGIEVSVGDPLGRYAPLGDAKAAPTTPEVPATAEREPAKSQAPAAEPASAPLASPPPTNDGAARPRATPLARRVARNQGVDLAGVTGSGRRRRIERSDVEAALAGAAVAPVRVSTPDLSFVTLPQGEMAYREWAPREVRRTVLFLHGFSGDSATWSGVLSGLMRGGARVIAPDLPSHGATKIESSDLGELVAAVAAFAGALELSGVEIVAHSMGAVTAVRAVAAGTLRASRLTLIAPAGLGGEIDGDFINGMAAVRTGGALAHLLRRLARRMPAMSQAQLDAMAASFARGRLQPLAEMLLDGSRQAVDIVGDIAGLTVPCRVVWGTADAIIPWSQVVHLPSRVAIHLIAGAGHMPHWDAPQELAAVLD